MKLKLSEIMQVNVDGLKPNKKNAACFRVETGTSQHALMEDIKKRGMEYDIVRLRHTKKKEIIADRGLA